MGDSEIDGGCDSSSGSGPEKTYRWSPPYDGCWEFDTEESSFDTVLRVWDPAGATCSSSTELDCDDDGGGSDRTSVLEAEFFSDESYIIVVDGYDSGDSGLFALSINACE